MPVDLLLRRDIVVRLEKDELDQNFIDLQDAVNASHNETVDIDTDTTLSTHRIALVDATAGAVINTLPPVATSVNQEFVIKKIDSSINTVTIATDETDVIEGTTHLTLTTQNEKIRVVSNGTAWYVI